MLHRCVSVQLSFALHADDLLLCNYLYADPIQCHDRSLSTIRVMRCRLCAAARAALHSALPQHPGFLDMALRQRYPLRNLDTTELPYCDLGSYLAKVHSGGIDTSGRCHTYAEDLFNDCSCVKCCTCCQRLDIGFNCT